MSDKQTTRNGLNKKELLKIIEDMDTRRRKEPIEKRNLSKGAGNGLIENSQKRGFNKNSNFKFKQVNIRNQK